MKVILSERIPNVGALGTEVRVKPGFARNYLLPQGKAVPATAENRAMLEQKLATWKKNEQERLQKAQSRAETLEGLVVIVAANAADEGRLFGSVGTYEIVRAMAELGHVITKNEVILPEGPIRKLGEYDIELHLQGKEIISRIKVSVVNAT